MNSQVVPSGSTSTPPKTPAAASTEPTERSMPPVAITKVIPIAITPTTLAWVSMLRTLSQVGNESGLRIAPTTNSTTTTIASAYSCSSRRRRSGCDGSSGGSFVNLLDEVG